jgi:hypothetical protein
MNSQENRVFKWSHFVVMLAKESDFTRMLESNEINKDTNIGFG